MIERLRVRNHRGVEVPAVLGLALAAAGALSVGWLALSGPDGVAPSGWVASVGAALVACAGLVDDLAPPGPRGLRGHLRALAGGRVTTGVVKLIVAVGSAVIVVSAVPARSGEERVAGIVLVAAATNLWNDLDVRPARALKFFYPAGATVFWAPWALVPFAPGVVLGSVLVLPWDAGERAMLGDAGANLLGFTAGLCLFQVLEGAGLWMAAALSLALNILAETVTLSRVIEVTPPLRWLDRLGGAPDAG
jgi:voltage-gated potassium channel Kch